MKLLLIPFLMFAAALTANAHCGTCGTGEAHAKPKAECSKDKAECSKDKAECSKDKAECSKDKAECDKPKATAAAAVPATTVASAPLMPCCAKK